MRHDAPGDLRCAPGALQRGRRGGPSLITDVLGFGSVDAGGGWLIFGLPPAEAAVHPAAAPAAELYLVCDDLETEMRTLRERGVACAAVEEARWGSITKIVLPRGAEIGLYQPRHPTAIEASR